MQRRRLVEIDVLAGRPAREVLAPHRGEGVVRNARLRKRPHDITFRRCVHRAISSLQWHEVRKAERQRLSWLDLSQQAACVENVLPVEQEAWARADAAKTARAASASAVSRIAAGSGLCASAPPVPITTRTSVRSLPRCTITGPDTV